MKNISYTSVLFILGTIFVSALVTNLSLVPFVNAQGVGDAYFTGVEYSLKIYQWTQDKWNFTVYNAHCAVDIWGRAWFFFKFYLDDSLWWDEFQEDGSWQLNKGSSTTHTYTVSLGSGPAIKDVKIELYWDYEGTPILEDTTYFSEKIVKLFVNEWSPSSLTVEKGKTTASTLSISFKNGGNDDMYSTKVAVTDSAGLEITPQLQTLENIASGGTKSTSFSVAAPTTATLGTHIVSFEISYNDFRGVSHSEIKKAYIHVDPLGTNIALSLLPSSLKIGASTTITAKLTDGNNVALANKEISFSIVTTSIGTATTDSSGNAVKTYTVNLDSGTYEIKASYADSIDYHSSNATSNLIVNPLDSTLTIDVPSATQGKECTLKATLKDEEGNPVQNVDVDFCIYEDNDWKKIGSVKTDSNGVASLSYSPSTLGTFQVKAMFGGTTNCAESSSTSTSLNVATDYTLYYVAAGITAIVIVSIVGYMVFRRRKKMVAPPK